MASEARRLAFHILAGVARGGPTLAERLAQPSVAALPARDRGFLHELVLGTLRQRGLLDHALRPLVARPLEEIDEPTLTALRLGAYQLLRMRVPQHAAVSESVELARELRPRAAGFVNAVLRRLAREGPPPLPEPESDPLGWLTTAGSLPRWLAQRWLAQLGPQGAVARATAFLVTPATCYRLNPRFPDAADRVAGAGIESRPLRVPGAWEVRQGELGALAAEGVLYPQDQGSQLVAHLAAAPGTVLDACAAPGGKSTLIADLSAGRGRVVACEVSRRRLASLARLVSRWGAGNVLCVGADALRPPFLARFDSVLLDAPCSGLGTLGRHPDIRWRGHPESLLRHARRQAALLRALAPLVAQGGRLVYATCSQEPEENEGVVAPFLAESPQFSPVALPDWAGDLASGRFVRTRPEVLAGDAFFAAVLRRV